MNIRKKTGLIATIIALLIASSGCAALGGAADDLNRALNGIPATMSTYTQSGDPIDSVHGKSFDIRRDETFDSSGTDGSSNKDSSVLKLAVGKGVIQHVGSTLILAEDGIVKVSDAPTRMELENADSGRPWLTFLRQQSSNLWKGKAKTLMIRSQNGTPIAVFAGNAVETFNPDIPKTTWFRVDGKTLIVYRADFTVYDTSLLS